MLLIDSDSHARRQFNTNSNDCLERIDYKSKDVHVKLGYRCRITRLEYEKLT